MSKHKPLKEYPTDKNMYLKSGVKDAVAGLIEELEADLKDAQHNMETLDNMKEVIMHGAKGMAFQISLKRIEKWLPDVIE